MGIDEVTIVGCGTVGSALAYAIAVRTMDRVTPKRLNLVDYDTLEYKNLPYLTLNGKNAKRWIGNPKVIALESILKEMLETYPIEIHSYFHKWHQDGIQPFNGFLVDCRDSSDRCEQFDLKLCCDGPYGSIFVKPDFKEGSPSRYTIQNSRYHAMLLASIALKFIFDGDYKSRFGKGIYVVDFTRSGVMQRVE